ncbi:MAG: signal peptidase I, partial [Candidatus Eremiobacteraeota bacterium]|nr:signal peptidase I [Candidatus Eremiobacteraeota bacterium]
LKLLALISVFALARVALSLRPTRAGVTRSPAASVAREYLDAFIVAGLVALFLITFVIRTNYIPSGSMLPTLHVHDVLLVNEFEYRMRLPRRGDIVVFKPPIPSKDDFIKRVVAVPGDTLSIHDGSVYVNGRALVEPYIAQNPIYELAIKNYQIVVDGEPLRRDAANIPPKGLWQSANRVPQGFYFMMGDNRNESDDSHIWGFAQLHGKFAAGPLAATNQTADFAGRAFLLFWPLKRLRMLH